MKNIYILPTNKPSNLTVRTKTNELLYSYKLFSSKNGSDINVNQHIYITSDEEIKDDDWVYCPVLKKPVFICLDSILMFKNLGYDSEGNSVYKKEWLKKIILTTDPDLIADGVQPIDDEFLEWFVKNPSCEEVKIEDYGTLYNFRYLILIPQEEPNIYDEYLKEELKKYEDIECIVLNKPEKPKQETLEEVAESLFPDSSIQKRIFIKGAKWQQEQILQFLYSEITERRPYSSSKMCEEVIKFIQKLK